MTNRCPPPPAANALPALRSGDLFSPDSFKVVRVYKAIGSNNTTWSAFRRFGPLSTMRFDHQPPPPRVHPRRGVMYCAIGGVPGVGDPLDTSIIEVFGEAGVIPLVSGEHWLAIWKPTRPLRLLALSDSDWITRAHANTALTSGPRDVARRWARTIWNAYPQIDGLCWSAAPFPTGRSLVLFERAGDAVPKHPQQNQPLGHPGLRPALARIATDYGLVPMWQRDQYSI